ncbi:MAG: zinc metallopeptidase [Clostridia bacterium]|nr:zinc metallopeptidase [Clostridia bacterium]
MDLFEFLQEYYIYIIIAFVVVFVLIAVIIANYSYDSFVYQFEKMKKVSASYNGSAYDLAVFFNNIIFSGMLDIKINNDKDDLSHGSYITGGAILNLSSEIAESKSIAGIAIVAHELGHAKQHFENSKRLINNFALSRFVKFLGFLNYPIFFLAIYLAVVGLLEYSLICLGFIIISFILAIILKFVTIKLEKDASDRAVDLLKQFRIIPDNEILLVKKFLKSARKTYIGDFFRALFAWTGLTRNTKFF